MMESNLPVLSEEEKNEGLDNISVNSSTMRSAQGKSADSIQIDEDWHLFL